MKTKMECIHNQPGLAFLPENSWPPICSLCRTAWPEPFKFVLQTVELYFHSRIVEYPGVPFFKTTRPDFINAVAQICYNQQKVTPEFIRESGAEIASQM